MKKEFVGERLSHLNIAATAPSGAAGILLNNTTQGMVRPAKWLVTAIVTVAPSDLFVWGSAPYAVEASAADDEWGLVNDRFGSHPGGKLGTALAIGTHHFVCEDLGLFTQIAFQKSAGTVDVHVRPIYAAGLGN